MYVSVLKALFVQTSRCGRKAVQVDNQTSHELMSIDAKRREFVVCATKELEQIFMTKKGKCLKQRP